ncbi:MAG: DUF4190 domain-containing protein [Tepidisphaeraceae bacterium]|jgi:hypothetical protein
MTQTNPTSPPRADSATDSDPLLHLHKMSTTAGLGSQDYVAVNVTAVIAVLFGLASLLAIASPVLLIFPLVGVALGVVALRQVKQSNGTQTGAGLAILGLALSGIITAALLCYQGYQVLQRRADQHALASLCQKFGELIDQRKFAEAYDLFDSDFQTRVSKQAFISQLTGIQSQRLMTPIEAISWNGLAEFHSDEAGTETADSMIKVHFKDSANEGRYSARFRRTGDGPWMFDNIPDYFPPARPPAQ